VIYFVSYENEVCFELRIIHKNGKVGFVSKHEMFQIQDMFENGKPDIFLKTVKRFNIKTLVMLKKMLVIVFTINFYFQYGPGS